ncbi:type II toxin-antitoxin system prevent-host-death family antitoxin [Streptomyces sp. NPDC001792]|uniref:type II toxin-antitoxin system Phd/YefM family antitoxin n=1 Tax=unclassified Streptomyces TaxID=2593676 RepID=UPI00331E632A
MRGVVRGPAAFPRCDRGTRVPGCSARTPVERHRPARGETVTVTKNGTPVARVVPISDTDIPPYPTDPMGDLDLPDLGLPDLTDDEIEDTLKGMGA